MKKHRTYRPTRLLSILAAFAMAALLIGSGNTAYADDTAGPDTTAATDTAAPATTDATPADPATTDPAPADPAPSADPAPATDSAAPATDDAAAAGDPASTGGDTPTTDSTTAAAAGNGPMMTTLKKLAVNPDAAPVDVTVPCDYADPGSSIVAGFEIDGNLCLTGDPTDGTEDWDSVDFSSDAADTVTDGFDDSTTFTNGDSENNDPSTWHIDGPAPNGKSDIGTAYAYSKAVGSDVFGFFAFTNTSTAGGTQQYDVEYNQNEATANANGATVPTREPGDLLFRFSSIGSAPMVFTDAKIYRLASDFGADDCFTITDSDPAGGWCTLTIPPGSFHSAASADGLFQEASIEISAFFAEGTCSGVFGTTQIRSVTGNAFATSALKDYVFPLDVTTPSTCGSLTIEKKDIDTGANVGGAVFEINGDPRPGENANDTLCIYDGPDSDLAQLQTDHPELATACDTLIADGTADGTIDVGSVEPGTYTITELVAPPGYLLDPTSNSQEVTIGEGEPHTVTFQNHKAWLPLTITKTADGTFGARYLWGITKEIAPTPTGPWSDGTTPAAPLSKTVALGGDTNLYYRVVVTEEGVQTSAYVVTGTIHVGNPNDASVDATLTESLTGCTLDSNSATFPADVTVPAGGADFAYTCDLGNGPVDPGTNTATVTWDRSTYPQTADDIDASGNYTPLEATDDYTFAEVSSIDKTITVTDDHYTFDPPWVITAGDEADGTYESGIYSFDTAVATAGTCSPVITNTATITGDQENVLGETSESGQVCIPAVIPPLPPEVIPPSLPNTGGPSPTVLVEGLWLVLLGGLLVIGSRRRRRS